MVSLLSRLTAPIPFPASHAAVAQAEPSPTQTLLGEMHATQAELIATLRGLQQSVALNHDALVRLAEPHQAIQGAIQAVAAPHLEAPKSRNQAIAAFLARWTTPVLQVMLGAAILAAGIMIMEIPLIAMGATYIVVGLGIIITLLASSGAPHPLDSLKHYFERRHTADDKPEITTEPEVS